MSRLARYEAEIDDEGFELSAKEDAIWDAFDDYMIHNLNVGASVDSIKEVRSYMRRHWWEYVQYVSENYYWEEYDSVLDYCNEEDFKREFLWNEFYTKEGNKNVEVIFEAIFEYVSDNYIDILFPSL